MTKLSLLIIAMSCLLLAAVPRTINFQGKLTDAVGIAEDGLVNITFILFNSESGSDTLWSETHIGVSATKGLFDVALGSINPFPDSVDFANLYWVAISVNGENLSPRVPLASVPYSLRSAIADSLIGGAGTTLQAGKGLLSTLDTMNIGASWGIGISDDSIWVDTTALDWRYGPDSLVSSQAGNGLYNSSDTINIGASYGLLTSADSIWLDTMTLDARYTSPGGLWSRDGDSAYIHPNAHLNVKFFDDTSSIGIAIRAMDDTAAILGKSSANDAGYLGSYLVYPVDAGDLNSAVKYRFPVYGISIDNGAAVAGYSSEGFGGLFTYGPNPDNTICRAGVYGLDVTGHECGIAGATNLLDYEAPYDTAVNAGVYGIAGGDAGFYVGTGTEGDMMVDITGDGFADGSSPYCIVALGATFGIDDKAGVIGKNYGFSGEIGYHGVGVQGWSYQVTPTVKGVGVLGLGGYVGVVGLAYYYGGEFAGDILGGKFSGGTTGLQAISPQLGIYAMCSDTGSLGSAYFRGNEYIYNGIRASLLPADDIETPRSAIYTAEGPAPQIIVSGEGRLTNGKAQIIFDDVFKKAVSDNIPIIVTVSPYDSSGQLTVVRRKDNAGFSVEEMSGNSSAKFGWIAIGVRRGYESQKIPEIIADPNFDENLLENKIIPQKKFLKIETNDNIRCKQER